MIIYEQVEASANPDKQYEEAIDDLRDITKQTDKVNDEIEEPVDYGEK